MRDHMDTRVYDAYPAYMDMLIRWSSTITREANFPLDQLAEANERMVQTRAFIGPKETLKIDPTMLVDHQELIQLARDFRNKYIELAMRATERE